MVAARFPADQIRVGEAVEGVLDVVLFPVLCNATGQLHQLSRGMGTGMVVQGLEKGLA
jgi:hypothetical protein